MLRSFLLTRIEMSQVFELLLKHALPGFTAANWRSRIRKEVSVHPEYHTLLPWNGVETADIVYHDTNSELTSALAGMGHMVAGTPTYYIEVKTTTGDWDNAFFMSKSQYRRVCIAFLFFFSSFLFFFFFFSPLALPSCVPVIFQIQTTIPYCCPLLSNCRTDGKNVDLQCHQHGK